MYINLSKELQLIEFFLCIDFIRNNGFNGFFFFSYLLLNGQCHEMRMCEIHIYTQKVSLTFQVCISNMASSTNRQLRKSSETSNCKHLSVQKRCRTLNKSLSNQKISFNGIESQISGLNINVASCQQSQQDRGTQAVGTRLLLQLMLAILVQIWGQRRTGNMDIGGITC